MDTRPDPLTDSHNPDFSKFIIENIDSLELKHFQNLILFNSLYNHFEKSLDVSNSKSDIEQLRGKIKSSVSSLFDNINEAKQILNQLSPDQLPTSHMSSIFAEHDHFSETQLKTALSQISNDSSSINDKDDDETTLT